MLWFAWRWEESSSKGMEQQFAVIGQVMVSCLQSSSCFARVNAVRRSVHPRLERRGKSVKHNIIKTHSTVTYIVLNPLRFPVSWILRVLVPQHPGLEQMFAFPREQNPLFAPTMPPRSSNNGNCHRKLYTSNQVVIPLIWKARFQPWLLTKKESLC